MSAYKFRFHTASKKVLGDLITPVSAYLKVRDAYPQSALMESSDYHGGENAKSFIALHPIASVSIEHGTGFCRFPDGKEEHHTIVREREISTTPIPDRIQFGLLAIRNAPKKGAGGGVGAFRTSKRTFTSSEIGASSGGGGPRVARRGGSWPGKVHAGTRRGHSWFFGPGKCPHLFRGDSGPGSGDVSPGLAAVSSPSS